MTSSVTAALFLWLQARESLWSNWKRTQSSESRFFLCKKYELLLRSLGSNIDDDDNNYNNNNSNNNNNNGILAMMMIFIVVMTMKNKKTSFNYAFSFDNIILIYNLFTCSSSCITLTS